MGADRVQRAPRPRFVGDTLRLNKLNVLPPDGAVPPAHAPEEVSQEELFECCAEGEGSPNLHNVLATSYGCDYCFVDSLVRGSPADLSGRVTIFDNQKDHARKMGGFDESTYPRRTVVMPHFHAYDSTQAERMRMQRGTMHPKLAILEFRAVEGAPCDHFLRLVVSSANLGRYDSKVNNQYWVHDFFPRAQSASPLASEPDNGIGVCPMCQESIGATVCHECATAIPCACARRHDWGADFCSGCSVRTALHHDLCRFLIHLFGPTREEVSAAARRHAIAHPRRPAALACPPAIPFAVSVALTRSLPAHAASRDVPVVARPAVRIRSDPAGRRPPHHVRARPSPRGRSHRVGAVGAGAQAAAGRG
jgi:hypothetical protein